MKILAFTDIHGSPLALKRLEQKVRVHNPDLLICAGDVSIFEHGIASILKRLNRLDKKILIIHGNHEDASTFIRYSKILKNLAFLHKRIYIENNLLVLGYGGGGFQETDKEFERIASGRFKNAIRSNKEKNIILLTHGPAYGTRLDKIGKSHVGNKSFANFIKKHKVDIMISGHLHENFGKEDKVGKTKVINPGPFGEMIQI